MKLMVLDGNSIINRSYYGIRPLTTRDGLYTHAVFGFLTTLQRLTEEEQPEALCVTFDRREPTFRHQADEHYKAQRKGMPEELAMQMPVLKEVLDAMNIPRYEMAGYEADDLIGTISRKCEAQGWECVVVTGDKDSLQLITDHTKVKLVSTRMGQTTTKDMTPASFREQYGFDPVHMIDLKALMGDPSDNITGVPGVGEKTAMALIQEYQSIDAIYEKLPDIHAKPAVIRKLTEGEESARHSYYLAAIVTDAPLAFDPQENLRKPFSPDLYELFLRLEFTKLIDKYGLQPATEAAEKQADFAVTVGQVTEGETAQKWLARWRGADHVAVYALPDLRAIGVLCRTDEENAVMAELFFDRYDGDWNALLNALFAEDIKKVSHHVKDLMRTLLENGLRADGFVFGTALASYLLAPLSSDYSLPRLLRDWGTPDEDPIRRFSKLADTLKAAVEHPKISFFNCSVDKPYTSVKTYYGRIHEAKYISGAIAGAMAQGDRIGYIASYPHHGVPASINAFALGAQLTNPRAQIELRWSCVAGTPQADFLADGIRVVSNRDAPTRSKMFLDFCSYGTYLMDGRGDLVPLGSPVWLWGKFYEYVIRGILSGGWKNEKGASALNYWLGMDSGVIDISLSDKLPEGVHQLARLLRRGLIEGTLDPFGRRIVSQDGAVRSDGTHRFAPEELLKMDWLCDNVLGSIPAFHEILPISQPLVRELGLHADTIPSEKERKTREDSDHIR